MYSHLAGYWIPGEVLGWSTGYSTLVVSYQYQSSCESWWDKLQIVSLTQGRVSTTVYCQKMLKSLFLFNKIYYLLLNIITSFQK